MHWCPYLDLEVPDLYSLVLPSLGRIEVVFPTILWLASVGSIIHCLHPSITSQFSFQPDWLLDLWHGGSFSPLEILLDKPPYLYCVSALSWWQNLPLVSWIVCLNHYGRFSRCLAMCRTPPGHLRCCWLKLKAHVLPMLKLLNMCPWKMKIIKLCFLTYVKRARAMKC